MNQIMATKEKSAIEDRAAYVANEATAMKSDGVMTQGCLVGELSPATLEDRGGLLVHHDRVPF